MELTGQRAVITLPERLTLESVARLTADIDAAAVSPARVVVLTGATPDVFCHGLALDAPNEGDAATTNFAALLRTLHTLPRPLLALVDGEAIGGGLGLAAACDGVIASHRATFALPELLWGLVPAIIWPVIADRMPPQTARRWTLSAHTRTAAEAQAAGLVDEVVAQEALPAAAARAERMLSRLDTGALVRFRDWARRSQGLAMGEALTAGAQITADLLRTPAARARWEAFTAGEVPWT